MNVIVIEPHADDAYLSLGGHIERWVAAGDAVQIVTVYSGTPKRGDDAARYARAVRAEWLGLGYIEDGLSMNAAPRDSARPLRIPDFRADLIIGPAGIRHPDHLRVAAALSSRPYAKYLDSPYHTIQRNSEEVTRVLRGHRIESFLKPGAKKWRHIPLFRTQGAYFFHHPPEKLRECVELVVT